MTDYLKAYIHALADEAAQGEKRFEDALKEKTDQIEARLQEPYRKAIALARRSADDRAQITLGIAQGVPEKEILDLCLSCIAGMCGDDAFYTHNAAILARRRRDPAEVARQEAENAQILRKREYNHLIRQINQQVKYLSDPRLTPDQQERALAAMEEQDLRVRALLAEIGNYTSQEATEGFAL